MISAMRQFWKGRELAIAPAMQQKQPTNQNIRFVSFNSIHNRLPLFLSIATRMRHKYISNVIVLLSSLSFCEIELNVRSDVVQSFEVLHEACCIFGLKTLCESKVEVEVELKLEYTNLTTHFIHP